KQSNPRPNCCLRQPCQPSHFDRLLLPSFRKDLFILNHIHNASKCTRLSLYKEEIYVILTLVPGALVKRQWKVFLIQHNLCEINEQNTIELKDWQTYCQRLEL
ncbi:hypothetical protein A6R68_13510, partial [Neotoma lepida]